MEIWFSHISYLFDGEITHEKESYVYLQRNVFCQEPAMIMNSLDIQLLLNKTFI